jgi:DNA repair protein RecN (Recombination protein N)
MLRLLRIRDFALLREVEIEFGSGLNLLTGETGSGKSIIVDALGLLSGERSSQEMVRTGCETAVLEGVFSHDPVGDVSRILQESGIDSGDDSLLIRREISTSGRNRIFINNSFATLKTLKAIGDGITDIHGQQDRQTLLDLRTHLEWLDRFGGCLDEAQALRAVYRQMRELVSRLASLKMNEQERLRRMDVLQYELDEIRRANLRVTEREELESEKKILGNRERIYALSSEAYALLYENEPSLASQAARLVRILQDLEVYDPSWTPQREALVEAQFRLEDLAYAARDYTTGVDFTPDRLEAVEARLSEIDKLRRKYGNTIAEILEYGEKCTRELSELSSYSDTSRMLSAQLELEHKRYLEAAQRLSGTRHKQALRLEREIRREFQALSMGRMELSVRFQRDENDSGDEGLPASYGPDGIDRVEFLIAPNRGEDLRPLAKIASGGELSRVMLSIRTLCGAGDAARTLVFDEVDAGIGGRVAETVGRRLRELARTNQVLCVTHLPQIAAFAAQHFTVSKHAVGSRTETSVKLLDHQARIEEMARMLGGEVITETARRHAREMLAHSTEVGA